MKTQPVPPERVMICAAEHPSGETIFVCRGMPGRFQVTPATPEEMAWIEEHLDQFRDFTDLHQQVEDLRKQLGDLGAILQKTEEARAALANENTALKAVADASASAPDAQITGDQNPPPASEGEGRPAAADPPAQHPTDAASASPPADNPEPSKDPEAQGKSKTSTKPNLK